MKLPSNKLLDVLVFGQVSTSMETRPISAVRFPLVTVCPPRDTYTSLNLDLSRAGQDSSGLDNAEQEQFVSLAAQLIQDQEYIVVLQDHLSFAEENKER